MLKALFKIFGYSSCALWLPILLLVNTQCSSVTRGGVKTSPLTRSLNDLHRAVKSTMRGAIKKRSPNTRTYYSNFHAPGMDINAGVAKRTERGQVVMTITGDRRPYQIIIVYRIETRSDQSFHFSHYDKGLALKYREKLKEHLASRPEQRDVIDDFRAY